MNAGLETIRVGLIDDQTLVRQGLRSVIDAEPDMQVAAETGDGSAALQLVAPAALHVVITESVVPGMGGVQLARELSRLDPAPRIIVLTRHRSREGVLELVHAGVAGYLSKQVSSEELLSAVRTVHAGGRVLEPRVLKMVLQDYSVRCGVGEARRAQLSGREQQVLELVARGHSSPEIAKMLGLSRRTVEVHRRNVMAKLNSHKITDLMRYAIKEGMV